MHIAFTVVRVGNPEANISVPHLDGLEIGNGKANGHGQAKKELVPRWGVASGQHLAGFKNLGTMPFERLEPPGG